MKHLFRDLVPATDGAWAEIEDEARRALTNFITARKLVDFTGPDARERSALGFGRVTDPQEGPAAGVESRLRIV